MTREDIDNEVKAIARLCVETKSNSIVEVMGQGWLPNHSTYYYIDMEYCGDTLEKYIKCSKQRMLDLSIIPARFQWKQLLPVLKIGIQMARGLEFIHSNGSVHRDLKPSNGALTSVRNNC